MPVSEYRDWQSFYACEPWGLPVWDAMHAHVISVLANINRDAKKRPKPYEVGDFLLFGAEPKPKETWAEISERMRGHVRSLAAE